MLVDLILEDLISSGIFLWISTGFCISTDIWISAGISGFLREPPGFEGTATRIPCYSIRARPDPNSVVPRRIRGPGRLPSPDGIQDIMRPWRRASWGQPVRPEMHFTCVIF